MVRRLDPATDNGTRTPGRRLSAGPPPWIVPAATRARPNRSGFEKRCRGGRA